jgi:hypothetical protein
VHTAGSPVLIPRIKAAIDMTIYLLGCKWGRDKSCQSGGRGEPRGTTKVKKEKERLGKKLGRHSRGLRAATPFSSVRKRARKTQNKSEEDVESEEWPSSEESTSSAHSVSGSDEDSSTNFPWYIQG